MKKGIYENMVKRYTDGAEILNTNTRILLSPSVCTGKKSEKALIIGRSAIYGYFAVTKNDVRLVHRTNGADIVNATWY